MITSLKAQSFRGGVTLGFVAAQIDGDEGHGWDKGGMTSGLTILYPLKENLEAQFEMKFADKGSAMRFGDKRTSSYYELIRKLRYIEIPFYLKYKTIINVNHVQIRPELEFGLYFGYLAQTKLESDGYSTKVSKEYHKFDLGSVLGVSYSFSKNLYVSFRFTYSLVPIGSSSYDPRKVILKSGQYNNCLSLSIYYII